MYCPNCQNSLTPPVGGQRLTCSLCGWVQSPEPENTASDGAAESTSIRSKAEEIARERQLDTAPVWRYVMLPLGALTVLLIAFNLIVNAFHKERPGANSEQSPLPEASQATPMPALVSDSPTVTPLPPPIAVTGSPVISGTAAPVASPMASAVLAQPAASGASPQASGTASPASETANSADSASPATPTGLPVSALPSPIPPSGVLVTPPPLPSPIAPSP